MRDWFTNGRRSAWRRGMGVARSLADKPVRIRRGDARFPAISVCPVRLAAVDPFRPCRIHPTTRRRAWRVAPAPLDNSRASIPTGFASTPRCAAANRFNQIGSGHPAQPGSVQEFDLLQIVQLAELVTAVLAANQSDRLEDRHLGYDLALGRDGGGKLHGHQSHRHRRRPHRGPFLHTTASGAVSGVPLWRKTRTTARMERMNCGTNSPF